MTRDELALWAQSAGWQILAGELSLTRPSRHNEAIVRLLLKATVAALEIKSPAGKWSKIASVPYAKIEADAETGLPIGLGFDTISGFRNVRSSLGIANLLNY
jgi:hypothetical protein